MKYSDPVLVFQGPVVLLATLRWLLDARPSLVDLIALPAVVPDPLSFLTHCRSCPAVVSDGVEP